MPWCDVCLIIQLPSNTIIQHAFITHIYRFRRSGTPPPLLSSSMRCRMKFIAFEHARSVVRLGRRIHDENPSSLLGGGGISVANVGIRVVSSFVDDRDDDAISDPAIVPPHPTPPAPATTPRNDVPIIGRAHRRPRSISAPLDRISMARMTRDMPRVQRLPRFFIFARAIAHADDEDEDEDDDVADRRCRRCRRRLRSATARRSHVASTRDVDADTAPPTPGVLFRMRSSCRISCIIRSSLYANDVDGMFGRMASSVIPTAARRSLSSPMRRTTFDIS
jgi:hypothetical protein